MKRRKKEGEHHIHALDNVSHLVPMHTLAHHVSHLVPMHTLAHHVSHLVPMHTLAHNVSHLCFQLLCPHNVIHHLWHVLPSGWGLFLCCCSLCRVCRLPLVMGGARGGTGGEVITQRADIARELSQESLPVCVNDRTSLITCGLIHYFIPLLLTSLFSFPSPLLPTSCPSPLSSPPPLTSQECILC